MLRKMISMLFAVCIITGLTISQVHGATYEEKIVFSKLEPSGFYDLWMMNPDGSDLKQLTDEAKNGIRSICPSIFPDGKRLLYQRGYNIHVLDLDTLVSTPVTTDGAQGNYTYASPDLSPDGIKIVYSYGLSVAGSCYSCTTWEIWMIDIDGGNKEQITSNSYRDAAAIFSPDGTKLLITHYQGAPSSDCCNQTDIYIYDLQTKTETRLYGTSGYDWGQDWSVAGIAFRESDPNYTISLINPDGSGYRKLFTSNVGWFSQFSPDGSKLFYQADPSGAREWDGYVYDFTMDTSTQITDGFYIGGTDQDADWGYVGNCEPEITVTPDSYDYGFVELGVPRTATITLTNEGGQDLTVSSIYLEEYVVGDPEINKEFSFAVPPPGVPLIVPPEGVQELLIEYSPKTLYNWASLFHIATADFVVTSDDVDEPEVRVSLSGKGALDVNIDQDARDFITLADSLWNAGLIELADNGNSGGNKFNALMDQVLTAGGHIAEGDITAACESLWGAYKHTDGQDKPRDFIYGVGALTLASHITNMMTDLGCTQTP